MPVPDSTRTKILKNLQTTLQGMTDASVYHYPVAGASQVSLDPTVNLLTHAGPDLPFYQIEPTPDGSRTFYQGEQLVEEFIVNVCARFDADVTDPLAKMQAWENLAADLEIALEADMTRGGFACDTRCGVPQPFTGVGSSIVITVIPVTMKIYRRYGVPSTP
jgi:hypothetical protein